MTDVELVTDTLPKTGVDHTMPPEKNPTGLPVSTLVIIVCSLGGVVLILAIVLICTHCKRRRRETRGIKTLHDETLGRRLPSREELDRGHLCRPRITVSANGEVNMDEGLSSTITTTHDFSVLIPPPSEQTQSNHRRKPSDPPMPLPRTEVNSMVVEDYINVNTEVIRQPDEPPALLPRSPRNSTARHPSEELAAKASELYSENSKLYHMYMNAAHHYEIDRHNISLKQKLGKGHFGTVYQGLVSILPQSSERNVDVAIKTMRNTATEKDRQEFMYEFEMMKLLNTLNHANIIKMVGCVTRSQPQMIAIELMPNGNLQSFLRDSRSCDDYYNLHKGSGSITERQLLKFCVDIARGMEGIADLQLLHRDLATRNILLDANLNCKVADFGFAKDVLNKKEYRSKSVFQRPRPTRWLAPESVFLFKHSIQSDVWSYGIVLWEIVTLGNLPYPGKKIKDVSKRYDLHHSLLIIVIIIIIILIIIIRGTHQLMSMGVNWQGR